MSLGLIEDDKFGPCLSTAFTAVYLFSNPRAASQRYRDFTVQLWMEQKSMSLWCVERITKEYDTFLFFNKEIFQNLKITDPFSTFFPMIILGNENFSCK